MHDMGAHEISNIIIWSSAKLGFDPDVFMPSMMH